MRVCVCVCVCVCASALLSPDSAVCLCAFGGEAGGLSIEEGGGPFWP